MIVACAPVDLWLLLAWLPILIVMGAGVMLVVACLIVEWDRHKAAKARRAAEARRRWTGMNQADR